jgi:AcrR family transcriptional regulator
MTNGDREIAALPVVSRRAATIRKADVTRERILDAAAAIFAEIGFARARLADIAERAKIKTGSLYYYFDSKDDLVEEVVRHGIQMTYARTRAAVAALPADVTASDRLRKAFESHLRGVLDNSDYSAACIRIINQVPEHIGKRYQQEQRAYGAYWQHLFTAAQDAKEIRADMDLVAVRLFIVGSLNWIVEWPPHVRVDADELVRLFDDLVFRGIRAEAG